jgi:hypothetical protein
MPDARAPWHLLAVDPLAAGCLQGAEQSIAQHMISLTFGHAGIALVPVK